MIELLILYELNKKTLTMYGISKEILSDFSVLTTPSFGTIKPALDRLAKQGCVKFQKTISSGGRPSVFYSIIPDGEERLKRLLLSNPLENPVQFLVSARIKISCSSVLSDQEQLTLFKILKVKSENIAYDIKGILSSDSVEFYKKMVFENLLCEYKNFVSMLEGLINACKN